MSRAPTLVLLAAGASSRLGTCKALVQLTTSAGTVTTPLDQLLSAGAALGTDSPIVVTGKDHAAIESAVAKRGDARAIEVVHNVQWERGRAGGIALAHARRPSADLCLAPVDVPLVSSAVFAALADAWKSAGAPARGWLAPSIRITAAADERRFGHPIVVGRALLDDLADRASHDPDIPLRTLRAGADPLLAIEVEDRAILDDLDDPGDLDGPGGSSAAS